MQQIKIVDTTLCAENGVFGFKEKLEIARQLEKLNVDVIEMPEIQDGKADTLLVRTISSFLKNSTLSVACGSSKESLELAANALSGTKNPRIRVELSVSPVGMEYIARKKPDKMLLWIQELVQAAKEKVSEVEFCAVDATRAEPDFLKSAIQTAVLAGATHLCLCDSAAEMLSDDIALFVKSVLQEISIPLGVRCSNQNGLGVASSILSAKLGADFIKTDVEGESASLETLATLIKNCGTNYGIATGLSYTELSRIIKQIAWVMGNAKNEKSVMTVSSGKDDEVKLDANDDIDAVNRAVACLGYDLSQEDQSKVYEEFLRTAQKKPIGSKELDAMVASVALQVPATYKLVSYVVNNGNIISSSAQITLEKDQQQLQGICIGDGPVDAAFRAIDQIIGYHYELDDFQIQSITEGKEAMGSALVKLRAAGKLYSGNGISTDIIGASIRAYLNAVNKIIYQEA